MVEALIGPIASLVGKAIDRFVPDKAEAERLKAGITLEIMNLAKTELAEAASIIKTEAQGESWLQRNWRPLTMLSFLGLLFLYWFGIQPDNLSQETLDKLFQLLQIGIGGYIVGRSVEKAVKVYKE